MFIYLLLLVASVFLGSQILAIPTPAAQITLYRIMAIGVVPLLAVQLLQGNRNVKIIPHSHASKAVLCFTGWWALALVSGAWAQDLKLWFQAMFLMTIGLSTIYAVYFWLKDFRQWIRLLQAVWVMMSALMVWGYFEIITNIYLLADIDKLDKYKTFVTQPMTRIPITIFANQNDYATMLIAYLCIGCILIVLTRFKTFRLMIVASNFLAVYLIYRSQSRMSLLCSLIFLTMVVCLEFKWDFRRSDYYRGLIGFAALMVGLLVLKPSILAKIQSLYYHGGVGQLSGDTARMNLWRMGFVFLAQSFGLGVGAGNIEYWVTNYHFLPSNGIVNIHNWWLEILVAYGWPAFILYVLAYVHLVFRLMQVSRSLNSRYAKVAKYLTTFLLVFVAASITSANNMLIEWHWVFFALIIGFVKLVEIAIQKQSPAVVKIQLGKVCER
ncbi:O-antigen ligase family protein [Vaginisenegalia massiliensis]|uniref:O-antigen ligase family protein n=1 Tax=Vaginisenegalia massiliensis TaxID=2058294 RepID=UPI000F54A6A9|nr:O-antigen ligase family protein [Vaginisenegalia massiliensis]